MNDLETREALLTGERNSGLAYEALALGDTKARKRLGEINESLVSLEQDRAAMQSAITEAERRCTAAQASVKTAAEKAGAEKALDLAKTLRDHGKAIDKAAHAMFAHTAELRLALIELSKLGGPNIYLADSALKRALITASMGSKLQLMHLAPTDRHSFAELTDRWAQGVTAFAERKLAAPLELEQKEKAA